MTERIRIDETSHPVDIKVRRIMKGHFLKCLDKIADTHSGNIPKNYGLMIYGSTLMRQLQEQGEVTFKYAGIKSSDIDIGGYVINQHNRNTTTKQEFNKYFAPILAETVRKAGFQLWIPNKNYTGDSSGSIKQAYSNGELEQVSDLHFTGDYYIAMEFSREQIENFLQNDPEYDKIKPYIIDHFVTKGRDKKTVCIAISAHSEHFPAMMQPTILYGKDQFDLMRMARPRYTLDLPLVGRARRYDMLAGKLARCMSSGFKPSDLIDIYSLVSTRSYLRTDWGDGIEENAVDANNIMDREVVRFLTINYLICGYGYFNPKSPDLLKNFENTPENKEKVIAKLKKQIVEYRQEEVFASLDEIYATVGSFIEKLFSKERNRYTATEEEKLAIGPLNLNLAEMNYIANFNGKPHEGLTDVESERNFWQKLLRRKPVVTREVRPKEKEGRFAIDPDLVANTFYCTFSFAHPDMDKAIRSNTLLNAKKEMNQFGPTATTY